MSDPKTEFRELMQRVQDGSEEAAQELHRKYAGHILRVVRRRLHKMLRPKYDSDDFVQSVWASFFTGEPKSQVFETPEALVRFLEIMARNKVIGAFRRRVQTAKHDVQRERSLD